MTKHAGSEAVLAATRAGDADRVVLRAVNVCGPHTTEASFLGAVMARLSDATEEEGIERQQGRLPGARSAVRVLRAAPRRPPGRERASRLLPWSE